MHNQSNSYHKTRRGNMADNSLPPPPENSINNGFDDWYHISDSMHDTSALVRNQTNKGVTSEETTSLVSSPAQMSELSTELTLRVFHYVPNSDLLRARLVCKRWNALITSSDSILEKYTCTVRNKFSNIDAFKTTTAPPPWKNYRFVGINLEKKVFGCPEVFRQFSLNVCTKLHCLIFVDCELPTGRFFELLGFCRNLKKLHIKKSPTMLQPDIGIFHWTFCFKYIKHIFAHLHTLCITQKDLSEHTLMGIARDMRTLVNLHISSEDVGALPVTAIGVIIRNNADSLSFLTLRGIVNPRTSCETGLFPKDLPEMKNLQILNIFKLQLFGAHSDMLETFLGKCSSLKGLRISCSHLNNTTLQTASKGLIRLELMNCTFDENSFSHDNLDGLTLLQIESPSSLNTGTENSIKDFLSRPKPALKSLRLGIAYDGNMYLNLLDKINYPVLKTFTYASSIPKIGLGIGNFIKNFGEQLKTLSIIDCAKVTSCDLEGLKGMKNLKSLNLAGTSVDSEISNHITSLRSLEYINLSKTKVTCDGLREILEATNQKLTRLSSVKIYSDFCKMSPMEFQSVKQIAPRVEIDYFRL